MKKALFTIALVVASGAALAGSKTPSFDEADRSKDGVISVDEAARVPGLDFAAADKDSDGTLVREEFDGYMATAKPAAGTRKPTTKSTQ